MQVFGRLCENCGLGMLPWVPRKRGPDGKLWCQNCREGRPGRPRAQAALAGSGAHPDGLTPTTVEAVLAMEEESLRLERAEAILGNWSVPDRLPVVVAHDSGDGQTIYHCPFCGGGQVIGRSDGTTECDFCHQAFTVQVQPQISAMPQTVDGVPVQMPGMPGGPPSPEDPEGQEAPGVAAQPAGAPQGAFVPPGQPGGAPGGPGGQGQPFKPPATKAAMLHTAPGGGVHGPYYIREEGGKFKVVNAQGEVKGTFDSKEEARQQQKALYANIPEAREQAEERHGKGPPAATEEVGKAASLQSEAGRFPCPGSNIDPMPSVERGGSRFTQVTPTFGQHHDESYGVCPHCQEPKRLLKSGKLPKHTRYLSWKQQQEMGLHEGARKTAYFIGPDGVAMPIESYIRHLALRFADDRDAVLADIRESNRA